MANKKERKKMATQKTHNTIPTTIQIQREVQKSLQAQRLLEIPHQKRSEKD